MDRDDYESVGDPERARTILAQGRQADRDMLTPEHATMLALLLDAAGDTAEALDAYRLFPDRHSEAIEELGEQLGAGDWTALPLTARFPRMARRVTTMVSFLLDSGDENFVGVAEAVLSARCQGDERRRAEAMADPLTAGLLWHEAGGIAYMLGLARGVLPADEDALYVDWATTPRSVFEVVDVDPGTTLTLTDLRTGETLTVAERSASTSLAPGELVCLHLLSDGEGGRFIAGDGHFRVRPGSEAELLDVLDDADPVDIADWVGKVFGPVTVVDRDGNVIATSDELPDTLPPADDWTEQLDEPTRQRVHVAVQERLRSYESDWLDMSIPALHGLTPREAAADPTRHEDLRRLFAYMESRGGPMDIERLRERLGFGRTRAADGGKVGRNDPCPCGSGAKYKRCHGA